jgi:ATP-binding cassette subfamily B (MDR/TAP) protein 1
MEGMKHYAQSAGYAEQALLAIKVVQTYGREVKESINYNKYLQRALVSERRKVRIGAFGISMIWLGIFTFYGYAFYFAGYSRFAGFTDNDGNVVTAGTIMICIFCIIMSSMSLGGITPNITPIMEGCVAGTLAIECIETKAGIQLNEKGTKKLVKEEIKGQLEFKDVCFSYPSNKQIPVLKNFSCTIKAG